MLLAFNANAQKPELISQYGNWSSFYYNNGSQKVCFITSKPFLEEGKYTSRGDVSINITSRPQEGSFDVFNINGGYQYKHGSDVTLKIGTTTITRIFTDKDKAWSFNSKTDKEIIDAFSRGTKILVNAINSDDVETKDTYSLDGFNEAYKSMQAKCGK